ncbi:MAG: cyclophilin-like fold protein [Chloroflexota bacterium]
MRKIRITCGQVCQSASLNDTETARLVWDALPFDTAGSRWGDEIYFSIPVDTGTERGQPTVQAGDLAYWEPGSAFCLFWGPTPMSRGDEIRPANPVTVFGKLDGDPMEFDEFRSGTRVRVERIEEA